jgi:hypothetical protein
MKINYAQSVRNSSGELIFPNNYINIRAKILLQQRHVNVNVVSIQLDANQYFS